MGCKHPEVDIGNYKIRRDGEIFDQRRTAGSTGPGAASAGSDDIIRSARFVDGILVDGLRLNRPGKDQGNAKQGEEGKHLSHHGQAFRDGRSRKILSPQHEDMRN